MKKRVLITGGSDGLGEALARAFVTDGWAVCILARNEQKTAGVAKKLGCGYVTADVRDGQAVDGAVQDAVNQLGGLDVVIANAGTYSRGALESSSYEEIKRVIDLNVGGLMFTVRAALPSLLKTGQGRVVTINSQGGLYPKAERSIYNASKWAVTGFARSLALELRPKGISVTDVYPGAFEKGVADDEGIKPEQKGGLAYDIAAKMVLDVCNLPYHVDVPELGMQSLIRSSKGRVN